MSDIYDQFARLAKALKQIIAKDGGTSLHVSACSITVPASSFERLCKEAPGYGAIELKRGELRLHGVLIRRGDDEATIRASAGSAKEEMQ